MEEVYIVLKVKDLIVLMIPAGLGLLVIGWLVKEWVGARINKSIEAEYNRLLEDYRFNRLKRQKAELVAALFSKWIKYRGKESMFLDKKELFDYYEDMNRMSIELSLWLDDKKILDDVMMRLQNVDNSKTVRSLVGDVRKLILEKDDDFDGEKIVLWPTEELNNIFNK